MGLEDLWADLYNNLSDAVGTGAYPGYKWGCALDQLLEIMSDGDEHVIPWPVHVHPDEDEGGE